MDSLRHLSPVSPADVLQVLPGMFWDHDCVMLPGLGGFVCNPRSAWYDEAKSQIVPPSRDVLFNPRLTTNDGLVANELMAKHGLTYRDALQAVEQLVDHVQQNLDAEAVAELPGLGKLYREEDGQIRFMADVEFDRMLRSFGHANIPLVPRSMEAATATVDAVPRPILAKAEEQAPHKPVTMKRDNVVPFRVQLGRAAAAVAIPLTLAGAYLLSHPDGGDTLLASNPLWNATPVVASYAPLERSLEESGDAQQAPAESVADFVKRTSWEGRLEFDLEAGRPAAGGIRIEVPGTTEAPVAIAEEAIAETTVEASVPVAAIAPKVDVKFLIVGGAFSIRENADKLAASMKAEGFSTSLHHQTHNGLTVVAMGGYATEGEAREALKDARLRGHKKAWLKRL